MELIVVLTRQHLIGIDQRAKALPLMQTYATTTWCR